MSKCTCNKEHLGLCADGKANPYFAKVQYHELQSLEGKVLTLLDAVLSDKMQNKAAKDMFRQQFWFQWVDNLEMKSEPDQPTGLPPIEWSKQ